MEAIAITVLVVVAVALVVVSRSVWRIVRSNDQPVAAGSFGQQFFSRRDKATKPEDWLER